MSGAEMDPVEQNAALARVMQLSGLALLVLGVIGYFVTRAPWSLGLAFLGLVDLACAWYLARREGVQL